MNVPRVMNGLTAIAAAALVALTTVPAAAEDSTSVARSALRAALVERGWPGTSARHLDDALRSAAADADSTIRITLGRHGWRPCIYSVSSHDGKLDARRLKLPSALLYDMSSVHEFTAESAAADEQSTRVQIESISTILALPDGLPEGFSTVRTRRLSNTRRHRIGAVLRRSSGSDPVVWDAGHSGNGWTWIRLRAVELILDQGLSWTERPDAWQFGRTLSGSPGFLDATRAYFDAPDAESEDRLAFSPIVMTLLLFGDQATAQALLQPAAAEAGNRRRIADDVKWVVAQVAEDDTLWTTVAPQRGKGVPARDLALHIRRHWTHLRKDHAEYVDALTRQFTAWTRGETRDANVMESLISVDRAAARNAALAALRDTETEPGYFLLRHVLRGELAEQETAALRALLDDEDWGRESPNGAESLRDVLEERLKTTQHSPR